MKSFFKKIYLATIGLTFLPAVALAEEISGKTPCDALFCNPLKTGDLPSLIENLAKYATQIGATVAVVMIIYSGYLFVAAQGKEAEIKKAKDTFFYTVIGTLVLLGAWVIATAVKGLIEGLQ